MKQSAPEAAFALHCRAHKLNPVPEFKFHPVRKWRADFAFPAHMILIEIEGGVWVNGRHNRAQVFGGLREVFACCFVGVSGVSLHA